MKRSAFIALFLLAGFLLLGCGSSNSNSGSHLYVVNNSAGSIGIYNIQTNGSLSVSNGSPFSVGASPLCLVFSPNGKFAYSVNKGLQAINVYAVNADGTLAAPTSSTNTSSTYTDSNYPTNLAIDSTGSYLYAADSGLTGNIGISIYKIDNTTGLISAGPASLPLTFPADFLATSSSAAGFLYASVPGNGNIYAYSINSSTGALTQVSAVTGPIKPTFLAFSGSGSFLLVTDNGGQAVWVYPIQSGALAAGSSYATGLNPSAIATSGSSVYITNQNDNTISVYAMNGAGQLGQLAGSPYKTNGSGPAAIAVSPQNNAVYVGDQATSKIDEYEIGSVNTFVSLSTFSASPLSAEGGPVWMVVH